MAGNHDTEEDPVETEPMDAETIEVPLSTSKSPKWPPNVHKRPDLEKNAVSSLPPSVMLRQVTGALSPAYVLNVRVIGIDPPQSELLFVRGHCPYYSCNSIVTQINWAEAGPLTFGKLARPYCPKCGQSRRRRFLNLFFHLELLVEDNLGQITKIILERTEAVRFLGLTVYRFLIYSKRRQRIKEMLDELLQASRAPRSDPVPGFTFDVQIMPVAVDNSSKVQFHMHGDNPPLFQLYKMFSH